MELYETLGVGRDATAAQIKKAYRKLARKWHPDHNTSPGAEDTFKEVNRAHEVLSDPEQRAQYDQYGDASLEPGFQPGGFGGHRTAGQGFDGGFPAGAGPDLESLFGSLFGGGRAPRRDTHATLTLDLPTSVLGGTCTLQLAEGRTMNVRIPSGVRDGGTLRLRGKGTGGTDLVLELSVTPHPDWKRSGDDLYTTLAVDLPTALRGGTVELQRLDGRTRLQIPPCAQNGSKLRLRGKGVDRKGSAPGDLYVTLDVRLPESLTPEAEAAIDTLAACYPGRTQAA